MEALGSNVSQRTIEPPTIGHLSPGQLRVLEIIYHQGPCSDEYVQRTIGWSGDTQRPRRKELEQLGLVEPAAYTSTGVKGRKVRPWRVTRLGIATFQRLRTDRPHVSVE